MINLLRTIHSFFVTSNCCSIDKIPKFSQKKEIVEVEVDINIIKKENSYCRKTTMNFKKVLEASFAPW